MLVYFLSINVFVLVIRPGPRPSYSYNQRLERWQPAHHCDDRYHTYKHTLSCLLNFVNNACSVEVLMRYTLLFFSIFNWFTLRHFSGENLLMANQPLLCNGPRLKATEFDEISQNKGHYAVQSHSRSPIFVPIESAYTISY